MTLCRLPASAVEAFASRLVIADKVTGATVPWVVTEPQRKVWREIEKGEWVFFAKPRQAYFTTAVTLDDVLWCWANDTLGHRVRCAFVIHTDEATRERATMARSFVDQLGIDAACNTERIAFPNGSELVFITAGGKGGAGRSGSFQRAHCSELPWWPTHDNPLTALQPTIAGEGQIIIETTLDVTAPSGIRAKHLWDGSPLYRKVFTSLEENPRYRADERLISDEDWARLQERGFTNRSAAAWWRSRAVPECENDEQKARREYPQTEQDMWAAGAGLWVPVRPKVTPPHHLYNLDVDAVAEIRRPLRESSGQIVFAVDTGKGVGRDYSAVVALDKRDHGICASFVSNRHDVFEFAALAAKLITYYSVEPVETPWRVTRDGYVPEVVVEDNAIGEAMVLKLRELGVSLVAHHTDEALKFEGLTSAKHAIVRGDIFGPQDLADECDELHQNERGEFVGRKDLLMAIGFALIRMRMAPYDPPPPPKRKGVVDVDIDAMIDPPGPEW